MTIEQNALRVAEFLRLLNEKIISDPEFRQLYGDMGRMDRLVLQTADALDLNFQRLEDARSNAMLFPGRRQYQDDVDTYLQGLAAAARQAEIVWREFRANTLTRITPLISQIEEEAAKPIDQSTMVDGGVTSAEETPTVVAPAKSNWLKTALNGLIQFKDLLTVVVDLDKAVTQASPTVVEGVKSAFDLLGQVHL